MFTSLGNLGALSRSTNPDHVGKIKVVLLGNCSCGKTTLASHLANGTPLKNPKLTVGCDVYVFQLEYTSGNSVQPYFVELWDIGTHSRYSQLRPLFYNDVNGALLLYDETVPRSEASVNRWAHELAARGTFSAAYSEEMAMSNMGELPVPAMIVATKADIVNPDRRSSGAISMTESTRNMLILNWQRLSMGVAYALNRVQSYLKLRHSIPGGSYMRTNSSNACATVAPMAQTIHISALKGLDKAATDALHGFFRKLIERRFFSATSSTTSPAPAMGAPSGHVGTPGGMSMPYSPAAYADHYDDDSSDMIL